MTTNNSNSSSKQILQPPGWAAPRGYANGVAASGRNVFVAGQIGWNAACQFESDDFIAQVRQTLLNIKAVLAEAGAEPRHMTRMTWYLTDKREYLARGREVGAVYREVLGSEYQIAMTAVQVLALMEDRAKVEIEVTAVVPETDPA
ncbi:enamine deaminase RidA (YjgF/YER057c/UK114 family) [Paucibacter oligotrophus]|uniref:Enamine deaminase RidA (YjgF/YER057c/UK114 family) n=1 Tax=Roseateles oligotrophus TaxID=1769250 RepID=A0A840LAV5_9BURK|nr:RidA family protein [Roseateles oligotrophus]MBB4843843.1 enamine deaminase RidA (YjgF/YER057c/UK114 family) [Roseateles oligotrophus]